MSNPFKETLDQVIEYAVDGPPEYRHLDILYNCLSNEEDKLTALDCGLVVSLFAHYGICSDDEALDRTRLIIVQMLTKFSTLRKGQDELFQILGQQRVLTLLKDQCEDVRIAARASSLIHWLACLMGKTIYLKTGW